MSMRRATPVVCLLASLALGCGTKSPSEATDETTSDTPTTMTSAATTDSGPGSSGPTTSSGDNSDDAPATSSTGPGSSGAPMDSTTDDPIIFDVNGQTDTPGGRVCDSPTLTVTYRDFASSHADFEVFWGSDATTGLVLDALGADDTPQYNPAAPFPPPGSSPTQITSADTFADWYHDVEGINVAVEQEIELTETGVGTGVFVFDDDTFFPLDGLGWNAAPGPNNELFPDAAGDEHNFHFTTEIHTDFVYEPGQVFTFEGDDDLWVFIDGMLEMDLGGLHGEITASIDLDTLGLIDGQTYRMDIFHAERRHDGSHFRVETSIACFLPPAG